METDATAAIFIKVLQLLLRALGQLPDTGFQAAGQIEIDLNVVIQFRKHGFRRLTQGIAPLGRQIEPVVNERRRRIDGHQRHQKVRPAPLPRGPPNAPRLHPPNAPRQKLIGQVKKKYDQ